MNLKVLENSGTSITSSDGVALNQVFSANNNGIIKGKLNDFAITNTSNTLLIASGHIIISGINIILEQDLAFSVASTSSEVINYLICHIVAGDEAISAELQLVSSYTAGELAYNGNILEGTLNYLLATITIDSSGITNLQKSINYIDVGKNKEDVSNKVTSLSSSSTDDEYPSAKCVYEALLGKVNNSDIGYIELSGSSGTLTDEQFAEAQKKYCIIKRGQDNFYKESIDSSSIHFRQLMGIYGSASNHKILRNRILNVQISSKAWYYNNFDENFYNKNIVDSFISKLNYYLGSFDSVSGNVITRQTGYVDFANANWYIDGAYYKTDDIKNSCLKPSSDDVVAEIVCSNSNYNIVARNNTDNTNDMAVDSTGVLTIRTSVKPTGYLQYKLATPYTETIIENQPLNTLDQKGSEWLRDEWEKTLNILDNGILNVNSEGYYTIGYANLKANTPYTITFILDSGSATACTVYINGGEQLLSSLDKNTSGTFTPSQDYANAEIKVYMNANANARFMLNKGTHAYPYQAYNGAIVHEKDIAPVLLWENASPNTQFVETTITLSEDITNYKYFVINFKIGDSSTFGEQLLKFKPSLSKKYYIATTSDTTIYARVFEITANANEMKIYNGNISGTASSYGIIPVAIYGTNVL